MKLAHRGLDEFVEKYASNISVGGLFIRTRDPQPIGSRVNFKIEIAGGQRVLQGSAMVKWVRAANDPAGPQGMGLEFLELDPASHEVVRRILAGPILASTPAGAPRIAPNIAPSIAPSVAPSIAPSVAPSIAPSIAPSVAPRIAPSVAPVKPVRAPPVVVAPPPPPPVDEELVVPPPAPVVTPEEAPSLADHPELFDLPDADTERAVDLDLDALIAGTPEPPPDAPLEAPDGGFDVDLDLDDELTAAAMPLDDEPPAPIPTAAIPPPPPPVRAPAPPIFLKPPASIDGTGPVLGIDLGTSNTCCAVLVNGKPQLLKSIDGYTLIPSIVAIGRQGNLLVGNRAKSQLMLNPTQSIYGAKRLVGRDYDSATVKQVRERFRYQIVSGPDGKAAVTIGPHLISLEEIQGLVLKECREIAERTLNTKVSRVVITCPAYYSEPQREAVRRAAAMAGLKVERILNEPTAAAMAYGLNRGLAKKVLIYDLGGGTFDATILRIDGNAFEVLATGGDIFLGGLDFDNMVVDELLKRFSKQHGQPFAGDAVSLSRIAAEAERTKIALTERTQVEASLPMLQMTADGKPLNLTAQVTRDELNVLCSDLVDRTIDVVKDVLLDAKLKLTELDDIVLVGGMSRMPLVRERLKQLFGKPPQASVNADEAVAVGAALYSSTLDKVSNVVLIDVVPMTIGAGLPGGGFKRVIERNTPLPATASFALTTSEDDEDKLELNLFQGEDNRVDGNEYLGTVNITGLPKAPKGVTQVAVQVRLDAECMLTVEARELRTRGVFRATMATRYTPDEIRSRLKIPEIQGSVQRARAEELKKRGGAFWGFLKRVVGRA